MNASAPTKWILFFDVGPTDDLTTGEIEIEAIGAGEAERWFFTETMLGRSRTPTIAAANRVEGQTQ